MVAVTSIAPKHTNEGIQLKAVNSWIEHGLKVYSFNHPSEIPELKKIYKDITFIPTIRTQEKIFGKHYVCINAIFDWAIENNQSICLINSDIEMRTDKATISRIETLMEKSIVMANRVNYQNDYKGNQYMQGTDAFFIHNKYLYLYPQTSFCLGQCHFDYYIPFLAIINGIETYFIRQNTIYHKEHNAQYSADNWIKTGHHFMWLTNMYQFANNIGRMSTHVYNYIHNATKRVDV